MKVSEQAQQQLRVLLARASVLISEVMEKERTSHEAFDATPAITRVALDLYALGFEAYQATDQSVFYWADEFEGILYCLTRSVTDGLQVCSPQQVKLLRKLKVVVTRIDEWHTEFIADVPDCPPECIFHPDHPGLVYAKK